MNICFVVVDKATDWLTKVFRFLNFNNQSGQMEELQEFFMKHMNLFLISSLVFFFLNEATGPDKNKDITCCVFLQT